MPASEVKKKQHRLVFELSWENPHIALWQVREALKMKSIHVDEAYGENP